MDGKHARQVYSTVVSEATKHGDSSVSSEIIAREEEYLWPENITMASR